MTGITNTRAEPTRRRSFRGGGALIGIGVLFSTITITIAITITATALVGAEISNTAPGADASPCPPDAKAPRWFAEWPEPGGARRIRSAFTGDAVLVLEPGASVRIEAAQNGYEVPDPRARVHDDSAPNAWAQRLEIKFPPVADDAATGIAPPRAVRLEFGGDGDARRATVWFHPAWPARAGRSGFGELRVGDSLVGSYKPPAGAGNRKVRGNPEAYRPPTRFFSLAPEALCARVTANLRVGDLVIPSDDTGERHSRLAPVNYSLWRAFEVLRAELAARGGRPGALRIISCFRAPGYNRRVGSGSFGRHAFGDAIDFMIDADGDGATDDLTGDGRVDRADGLWVVALLEELMADGSIPLGGIGCYTFAASPKKVTWHYDQRGHRATWGYHHNAVGRRSEFAWQSRRFADIDARERSEARERARAEGKPYAESRRDPLPTLPRPAAAPTLPTDFR